MTHEYTSERIAAIAARVLRDPLATEDAKALAGSALTQARDVAQDADECAATGQSCEYGPHGPKGETQCAYCGATPDEAQFELTQEGVVSAVAIGKRQAALAEIKHYAAVYSQDGPVEVFEVTRRPVNLELDK